MNDQDPGSLPGTTPARGDAPAERNCLRCQTAFWSEGFGERICKRCKAQACGSPRLLRATAEAAAGRPDRPARTPCRF